MRVERELDKGKTMRAAVLAAPRWFEIRDVPRPVPGPGEVLIRIEGCGLCGSNLPLWQGRPWFQYPLAPGAPGHEGWGRVAALGTGVAGLRVGDRVAALSQQAFAEYDVARADHVVALPRHPPGTVSDADLPGEPLACAINVWRRSDVRRGHWVAIVGVGFLGAVLAQLAIRAGASVIAISRRETSRRVARAMGAVHVLPLDEPGEPGESGAGMSGVIDRVGELTGGQMCDRVIEVTGLQGPLTLAGALTRVRGRLIIAGFHQDGTREIDLQLWNWRGIDVINAHERDPAMYVSAMRAAFDAIAAGSLSLWRLVTHTSPLDRIGDAFSALETRPDGFVKGQVRP